MNLNLLKNENSDQFFEKFFKGSDKEKFAKNLEVLIEEISLLFSENLVHLKNKKKPTRKKELIAFVNLVKVLCEKFEDVCQTKTGNFSKITKFSRKTFFEQLFSIIDENKLIF